MQHVLTLAPIHQCAQAYGQVKLQSTHGILMRSRAWGARNVGLISGAACKIAGNGSNAVARLWGTSIFEHFVVARVGDPARCLAWLRKNETPAHQRQLPRTVSPNSLRIASTLRLRLYRRRHARCRDVWFFSHGAVLLAPAEDTFGHRPACLRHAIICTVELLGIEIGQFKITPIVQPRSFGSGSRR